MPVPSQITQRIFFLLCLSLSACSSFPARVQFGQLEDDVMTTVDSQWLRRDLPLEVRLHFHRPVDAATLAGLTLHREGTGQRLSLEVLHVKGQDVLLNVGPPWENAFAHGAGYALTLDGSVRDASGRPFAHASLPLRAELRPYRFHWRSAEVRWVGRVPLVQANVTNLLGEPVPGRAVRFEVVCDQRRGGEEQTVYFAARSTPFAPREQRTVTLHPVREQAFQPAAWPDVPFGECRNEGVRARTQRRASLSVPRAD